MRLTAGAEALLCFILPVSNLLFLATGPHGLEAALLWTLPVWLCVLADYFSPSDMGQVRTDGLQWLLDARLYVLFGLQMANILLLLEAASRLRWDSYPAFAASAANIAAMRILVGTASCCCGLAVAHELIHRRSRIDLWLGRILLWTVCYDHFAIEHVRGHHRQASMDCDPATARFGESFRQFLKRSLHGQWANAWRLENQRLRRFSIAGRWLRHRLLHGLLMEFTVLSLVFACFGLVALLMFLYQAMAAVRMLEAVNYIQHWGLARLGARFEGVDAWYTDSWFTLHSFIGLSRHADHHACAATASYRLIHREEGPRLPHGYFAMVVMVRLANGRFLKLAAGELEARRLGPFRPKEEGSMG